MSLRKLLRRLPVERFRNPQPVVSVLRLSGVIAARLPRGLSLASQAAAIERAFAIPDLVAVALAINSPGGSPVQSALIYRRIRQLAAEKKVPVFAFAEDVAASGGYWLALAGDEIYAQDASIVGSIGVVSASFGFQDLLRRLGVERRVYTAGENKSLLDPFRPEDPRDVERLIAVQKDIHESFKDLVRERRGAKLTAPEERLFNGDIFTGRSAVGLGLVDAIGDLRGTMRARFGERVRLRLVDTERKRRFLPRLPFFSSTRRLSSIAIADIVTDLAAAVEERLMWSRFGL
jgi:signal peptide peptidase SppA